MMNKNKTKKYGWLKYSALAIFAVLFFNLIGPVFYGDIQKAEAAEGQKYWYFITTKNNQATYNGYFLSEDDCDDAQEDFEDAHEDSGFAVGSCKDYDEKIQAANIAAAEPSCSLFSATGFKNCIGLIFYFIWYITSLLAMLAAKILDFFIGYSLDDKSYRSVFVTDGWKITRDIANLVFIFILIYAAIKTVIGGFSAAVKETIKNIIIVALLINFSLFMVRALVDSTNILARIFYNNIEVTGTPADSIAGTKPVSVALVDKFDPQKLILNNDNIDISPSETLGLYILITLLASYVNIVMFSVFFSVGIFFLGRVIGLWIAMIFAPFAFISLTLPSSVRSKMQDWGWDKWLSSMVGMAIMAPIFTFFLYLIILFGNMKTLFSPPADASITQVILAVIIPFLIIIALLKKAKELTSQYAGEIGTQLAAVAGKITGLAATAAAALPVGRVLGAGAGVTARGIGAATREVGKTQLGQKFTAGLKVAQEKGKELALTGGGFGALGRFAGRAVEGTTGAARTLGKSAAEEKLDVRRLAQTKAGQFVGAKLGAGATSLLKETGLPGAEKLVAGFKGAMAGAEKGVFGGYGKFRETGLKERTEEKKRELEKKIRKSRTDFTDAEARDFTTKRQQKYNAKLDEAARKEFFTRNPNYTEAMYQSAKSLNAPAYTNSVNAIKAVFEAENGKQPKIANTALELNRSRKEDLLELTGKARWYEDVRKQIPFGIGKFLEAQKLAGGPDEARAKAAKEIKGGKLSAEEKLADKLDKLNANITNIKERALDPATSKNPALLGKGLAVKDLSDDDIKDQIKYEIAEKKAQVEMHDQTFKTAKTAGDVAGMTNALFEKQKAESGLKEVEQQGKDILKLKEETEKEMKELKEKAKGGGKTK